MFRAAVAFAKRSGVKHIAPALAAFAESNPVEIIVGVDHHGTSYEGLKDLLDAVTPNGRIIVFHNRLFHTFHPKIFLFKSNGRAEIVIGSGNLTEGGLYTNYEAGFRVELNLRGKKQRDVLVGLESILDTWADDARGTSRELSYSSLDALLQFGLVINESDMKSRVPSSHRTAELHSSTAQTDSKSYFDAVAVPPAPTVVPHSPVTAPASQAHRRRFVMTLLKTDVGVGQTNAGTSRRSPEIFIPMKARNAEPQFWKWKDGFEEDPNRPNKFDRKGVRMLVGGAVVSVSMMVWPVKRDFRLRSEALRSLGNVGDILVIEKLELDDRGIEYDVSVVKRKAHFVIRMHCGMILPIRLGRSERWITSGFGTGFRVSMS